VGSAIECQYKATGGLARCTSKTYAWVVKSPASRPQLGFCITKKLPRVARSRFMTFPEYGTRNYGQVVDGAWKIVLHVSSNIAYTNYFEIVEILHSCRLMTQ